MEKTLVEPQPLEWKTDALREDWQGQAAPSERSTVSSSYGLAQVRYLRSHVSHTNLEYEQNFAQRQLQKVRHVMSIAPWLWRQLRRNEEHLLRGSFGCWHYAATAASRVRAEHLCAAGAPSRAAAVARDTALRMGAAVLQAWRFLDDRGSVVGHFHLWRVYSAVVKRTRHFAEQRFAQRGTEHMTVVAIVVFIFCSWRAFAVAGSGRHQDRENGRHRRRNLRLALCQASNEIAGLQCEAQVAEARSAALRMQLDRVSTALQFVTSPSAVSDWTLQTKLCDESGSATSTNDNGMPCARDINVFSNDASLDQALREEIFAKFVGLRSRLVGTIHDEVLIQEPLCSCEPFVDEMRQRIRKLRAECAELADEVNAERDRRASEVEAFQSKMEVELMEERVRSKELSHRLSEARAWVTVLRERHRDLMQHSSGSREHIIADGEFGPRRPACSASHDDGSIPQVQRALTALATASEQMLGVM